MPDSQPKLPFEQVSAGTSSITEAKSSSSGIDLSEIATTTWDLAKRRYAVLESLLHTSDRRRSDVRSAARRLGRGMTWAYEMLARLRADTRLTSLLPRTRGRPLGTLKLGHAREEIVRVAIDEVYLTRQQPSVSALMIVIRQRCLEHGLTAPGRRAVQRRIGRRSAAEVLRLRRGKKEARDRFAPVTGSLTVECPLAVVQIDHTLVDVMLVDSATREPIKRPWLTLAIDVHTRCVLGFSLSLDPPSATSVALCISHAVLPKDGWLAARGIEGSWIMAGRPRCLHLDNGREFHSHALSRGCDQYGIELQYRPVRTPHYGGHIERLIGTFMEKSHLLPGTTFSNIRERGDLDPEATAALTLEELERWLATAIVGVYHETVHRGIGTTPASAWRQAMKKSSDDDSARPVEEFDPRRVLIDFLPFERRLVRREGVVLLGITYWADVLSTWIGEHQRMIVRYDPRDLSRIFLLAPDGEYYDLPYRDLYRPAISIYERRAALKRLRAQGQRSVDEAALFGAITTMRHIGEHATKQTKILRRQRERQRRWRHVAEAAQPSEVRSTDFALTARRVKDVFSSVEEWM